MNRRWMWVLMLVCVLLVMAPRAWAQWPPETHPADQSRDIVMTWDRSTVPGDVELWAPRTVLGFSHDLAFKYGQIHVVCQSDTDSAVGRCRTEGQDGELSGESQVVVRAVEQRTGLTAEFLVTGHLLRIMADKACYSDYWHLTRWPLYASKWRPCSGGNPLGTGVELRILESEISRLVAGHWKATMRLNIKADPAAGPVATAVFNFDFTITDYDAISIYFPAFESSSPHINLNLRYDPIRQTVGGRTQLDMCLYDGLGSQSEYLGVTVRDSSGRPPGGDDFSAWHQDGGSDESQRLDFTVGLNYGGSRRTMKNGVEQLLYGIESGEIRMIVLPGTGESVYCVPTPLTLETPLVPVASKRPGFYNGELQVQLRVPTARP
ncbi:CfaE/CblD family pilus tip adhesin [Stenotrophomonas maltophilia]|uniref:CfaE/CblD family pilus tip adhesin n=1 Tax=Stenotrophomonas maltophilia TaxID=40324 RepID=UPI00130F727A